MTRLLAFAADVGASWGLFTLGAYALGLFLQLVTGHSVQVIAGTLLHRLTGASHLAVNSAHHQAVKEAGAGLVIDAVAEDGVVEGIEDPRRRFCLGLQWHPEFEINEADRRLFRAFVEACGG